MEIDVLFGARCWCWESRSSRHARFSDKKTTTTYQTHHILRNLSLGVQCMNFRSVSQSTRCNNEFRFSWEKKKQFFTTWSQSCMLSQRRNHRERILRLLKGDEWVLVMKYKVPEYLEKMKKFKDTPSRTRIYRRFLLKYVCHFLLCHSSSPGHNPVLELTISLWCVKNVTWSVHSSRCHSSRAI